MLIWRIDAAFERARLALAIGNREQAMRKLSETRQLIRRTEKPYDPQIVSWQDWQPGDYINVFQPAEIVGYHRRNPEIESLKRKLSF